MRIADYRRQAPAQQNAAQNMLAQMTRLVQTQRSGGYTGAQANPALLGRPQTTFVQRTPVNLPGPTPRLARGIGVKGAFGSHAASSNPAVPAFIDAVRDYKPAPFNYAPTANDKWIQHIPKTSHLGVDGSVLFGTYRAHDFTIGEYQENHRRRPGVWQVQAFPANWRNLVGPQLVRKYQLQQYVTQARPLSQNDYFLGYQVSPQIAQQLGSGGAGIRPLGY